MKVKLLLIISLLSGFTSFAQQKIAVQQGTPIHLKLMENISTSASKVGDIIDLEVAQPIVNDNRVMVQAGLKVSGQITELNRPAMRGKSGKLSFAVNYLTLADGRKIKVSTLQTNNPKDVLINFTFGKGRDAFFDKGYTCDAFIDQTFEL